MALVIGCPCGELLECENLELVVSLGCPKCQREVTLEFDDEARRRCRGVLTIMEGPHWVGERFVVPVGLPLRIGSEMGNWIALDDDKIDKAHCEIRLTNKGSVVVEDLLSKHGVWVGGQRVSRAKIDDKGSFRIGDFRFRLDYELNDGASKAQQVRALEEVGIPLPDLQNVRQKESIFQLMTAGRYHVARAILTVFAWLTGTYHACFLYLEPTKQWPWYWAVLTGMFLLIVFADLGRRVALLHPYMNYISIALLIVLGIVDASGSMPFPAVGALVVGGCLAMLTIRIPSHVETVIAMLIGVAATVMMAVVAYQQALGVIAIYSR